MTVVPNKRLISLRQQKGESQAQAAKGIGISQSMLAMLEAGYRRGGDTTKVKIADYFNTSVDDIFFAAHCHN
ncbi:helix-turn-helix transcriptional regulator [Limosilactobacillus oris]|uniref:helix-turn-helix transcriptional regulator n=1 Tax=Limosilactobacillus oris TaxID=1632 RepID=UPI0022354A87|nr:helix-turn-helix transcriptional regulator [Limosilactobacillus oris]MCW4388750.1 helix-turn-helix transcriptional regulator [Limosilactobacillus oris]